MQRTVGRFLRGDAVVGPDAEIILVRDGVAEAGRWEGSFVLSGRAELCETGPYHLELDDGRQGEVIVSHVWTVANARVGTFIGDGPLVARDCMVDTDAARQAKPSRRIAARGPRRPSSAIRSPGGAAMGQFEQESDEAPDAAGVPREPRRTQPRQAVPHDPAGGGMAHLPTCEWAGISGATYTYHVYALPPRVEPDRMGNYIYARWTPEKRWLPICLGEGDLSDAANECHTDAAKVWIGGATHFHCHVNPDADARRREEVDLLSRYPSAFRPTRRGKRSG